MSELKTIGTAEFNPAIKTYILLVVAFFLTISLFGIPLLLIWFLGFGNYIGRRYYESLQCTLTNRHLEFKKGAFFKVEKTIPLENIQDLTFIENPFLKLFDMRILKIETAGNSNPHGTDMKLIGIIDSIAFKEKVLNQREMIKNDTHSEYNSSDSNNTESVQLLKEIRDQLIQLNKK